LQFPVLTIFSSQGKLIHHKREEIMDIISELLINRIFLSAMFSWLVAQLLKSIIEIFKNRPHTAMQILAHFFWSTGGMPSSHASVVTAIATSTGFVMGLGEPIFIVTLFYALLVIRDALGVRRAAGHQAKTINTLINYLKKEKDIEIKHVKEIHGHSISEVSIGALLGFFIAIAFCNL
jgi:acid phosphatase family membrane protein YuiD